MFKSDLPIVVRIAVILLFVLGAFIAYVLDKKAKTKYKDVYLDKNEGHYNKDASWSKKFKANVWFTTSLCLLLAAIVTIFI